MGRREDVARKGLQAVSAREDSPISLKVFQTITFRLTLWYAALMAVVMVVFTAGIHVTLRASLVSNLDDALSTRLAELLPTVSGTEADAGILANMLSGGDEPGDAYVRVYFPSGELADSTGTLGFNISLPSSQILGLVYDAPQAGEVRGDRGSYRFRIAGNSFADGSTGALEVGRLTDDIGETMRALVLIAGLSFPIALVVAIGVGLFLADRALTPVSALTSLARRITADDLGGRIKLEGPDDELRRLAATFNEMIARLDADFQRQRQFTADASHELRTPLTAIKGQVEVTLSLPRDTDEYRDALHAVGLETDRLVRLVNNLLLLARADSGQLKLQRGQITARQLIENALTRVRSIAAARNVQLKLDATADIEFSCDEQLLLQLLLNLFHNALDYTPSGGEVVIGCNETPTGLRFWVRDTGAGTSASDMPHIFDRFYRADDSRSRKHGGAGLGLSICRWIAEAHGGSITVESVPGRGSTFTLDIPRP